MCTAPFALRRMKTRCVDRAVTNKLMAGRDGSFGRPAFRARTRTKRSFSPGRRNARVPPMCVHSLPGWGQQFGMCRPPSRLADIGADHRRYQRHHRDTTKKHRHEGLAVKNRCRGEAPDEDGCRHRIPSLATRELLGRALRGRGDQRRPSRASAPPHASIILDSGRPGILQRDCTLL